MMLASSGTFLVLAMVLVLYRDPTSLSSHGTPLQEVAGTGGGARLVSRVRTQCKVPRPRQYEPLDEGPSASARRRADQVAAGFLSNITNPKVLVGSLAVLPQFLGADAGLPVLLAYALSHAALSLAYLTLLVVGMSRARRLPSRRRVRRLLDAMTGVALLGFGTRLLPNADYAATVPVRTVRPCSSGIRPLRR